MSAPETTQPLRDPEGQEKEGTSRLTILAGLVLLAIVAMAAALVITGNDQPTNEPAAVGAPREQAPARVSSAGTCPETATQIDADLRAPASKWELIGTMAAPSDAETGPSAVRSGYRVCFAHSTAGALYAATEFLAVATSPLRGPKAVRTYMADTPERVDVEADPESRERLDAQGRIQVRGFQVERATADRAVIGIALGVEGAAAYAHVVMAMRWENDDWKVVPPPTGKLDGGTLDDLRGFTAWSGA